MKRFILAALVTFGLVAPTYAAVEIQDVTSPGGIRAWLVQEDTIPFVALDIRFRGGTALDRDGKHGAINLMTGLLEEGAGDLNAVEFAKARDALAASYEFDAYNDSVRIKVRFLSENRDEAVDLLRAALTEPRFDEDAVARVRDQVLSILANDAKNPSDIARSTFNELAFAGHPYAIPSDGTIEAVRTLTRDDVVQAHRDVLVRDRIFVGAVGDISEEELGGLLDTLLGDLPQSGAPLPGDAGYAIEPGVTVVDFATPQSLLLFGHEGLERDDPDFITAYILNEIFGGRGFNSRLMEEVRVKRGLTYGIGTFLSPMLNAALLMGQANVENSNVAEAVEVIREEWSKVAEGVTEEELEAAKTYLTGAYPLRFDGNATIAGIMVGMQMQDLPIDYIATRNDQVNAVTLDDIRRVADRLYREEDLSFVIVGQPRGIDPVN